MKKFQVVQGGKDKEENGLEQFKYTFVKGYCTNTRLMGVIGAYVLWLNDAGEEVNHFFHLDFEEYGIDGFEAYKGLTQEEILKIQGRVMGGLGGDMVEIDKDELILLLKESYDINIKYQEYIIDDITPVMPLIEYQVDYDKSIVRHLYKKIMCQLVSPEHRINYYVMRQVAVDYTAGLNLLESGKEDYCRFKPTEDPSTLIKNSVEYLMEDALYSVYKVISLIDYGSKYKHIVSTFKLNKLSQEIAGCEIDDTITNTSIEAAFQLKKEEYIAVYHVNDLDLLEDILVSSKPDLMKNAHINGNLYTEFYKHNKHVDSKNYYLNGDVELLYYVTDGKQLVISSFVEENLNKAIGEFNGFKYNTLLDYQDTFKVDISVLYDFVNSSYEDFFDYLDSGIDRNE